MLRMSCAVRTIYQLGPRRKQTCPSSEQLYSGAGVDFVTLLSPIYSFGSNLRCSLRRDAQAYAVTCAVPDVHLSKNSAWIIYIYIAELMLLHCQDSRPHWTSSCLYNHDRFNALTETEKEKWFAFILRFTGAAVSAVWDARTKRTR